MSANTIVRRFQANDVDQLTALWNTVLPSSQSWNDPQQVLCRKLNRYDGLVFVAERDGAVVGAVLAGYDGVRGWIYQLAVAPEHQRCGIGRMLLSEAESALLASGCPKVNLQIRSTNAEVLEFYWRCGYETEERLSLGKPLIEELRQPADPVPFIQVTDKVSLSQISLDDKPAYLKHLNETDEFYANMCVMPYPYTDIDADQWIAKTLQETLAQDRSRNWGIRNEEGKLTGGVSLINLVADHQAEIGYWLAKSYWGKGIMTQVVQRLCRLAFDEYRLQRIYARVFAINPTSARVLQKVGFRKEGTLRNHFFRDGRCMDMLFFGLLREELSFAGESA